MSYELLGSVFAFFAGGELGRLFKGRLPRLGFLSATSAAAADPVPGVPRVGETASAFTFCCGVAPVDDVIVLAGSAALPLAAFWPEPAADDEVLAAAVCGVRTAFLTCGAGALLLAPAFSAVLTMF